MNLTNLRNCVAAAEDLSREVADLHPATNLDQSDLEGAADDLMRVIVRLRSILARGETRLLVDRTARDMGRALSLAAPTGANAR